MRSFVPYIPKPLLVLDWIFTWVKSHGEIPLKPTPKDARKELEGPVEVLPSTPEESPLRGVDHKVEEGFRSYYHTYRSIFYLFTYKIVQNKEIAKDIVSDTYLTCWEIRQKFGSIKDLHAYMYVSCKNRAFDFLKHGRGFKNKREVAVDPTERYQDNAGDDDILNEMIRWEYYLELRKLVDQLPAQRKEVIRLHYMEGYSLEEVAQKMNMTYMLVKTVKSQALAQLRSFMKM